VDTTWVEALMPLLRRGAIPTVLLLDPASFGGRGNWSVTRALLVDLGVAHYVITRDLLDRPVASLGQPEPGSRRVPGTRRAGLARQPRERGWEVLS